MTPEEFSRKRVFIETSFGRIAMVSRGEGSPAIFLHGVPLNGYHWRGQLERLGDLRTCSAIDLMGLGHSEPREGCPLDFPTQADMVLEVADKLGFADFDLVANDSGGAIAQIAAAKAPNRIRSLVLTNCDVHDNWPPPAFMPAFALAKRRGLANAMADMLAYLPLARSDLGLGAAFENPEHITAELIETYIGPLVATPQRRELLDRYVATMNCAQTVAIEPELKHLKVPTLIVWGTSDVFFSTRWAHWLKETLPLATEVVEVAGSRLFLCEERPEFVSQLIRQHWTSATARAAA